VVNRTGFPSLSQDSPPQPQPTARASVSLLLVLLAEDPPQLQVRLLHHHVCKENFRSFDLSNAFYPRNYSNPPESTPPKSSFLLQTDLTDTSPSYNCPPSSLLTTKHQSAVCFSSYRTTLTAAMSAKSILEADGKAILNYHLTRAPVIKPTPLPPAATHNAPSRLASLYFPEDVAVSSILDQAEATYPWLLAPDAKFVAKPDQLIKRRGKSGLLALNKTWPDARAWIEARAGKEQKVETVTGYLRQFLVEPFVPHPADTEYYININSVREVSKPDGAQLTLVLTNRLGGLDPLHSRGRCGRWRCRRQS
jgi:hypothetical protein